MLVDTRISASDMSYTRIFPMNGVGESIVSVSQFISKFGSKAQPDPRPIPKGYGTVRFPHFFGHPGFVIITALVIVVVAAVIGGDVVFVGGGGVVLEGIIWAVSNVKISINEIKKGSCLSCMFFCFFF